MWGFRVLGFGARGFRLELEEVLNPISKGFAGARDPLTHNVLFKERQSRVT